MNTLVNEVELTNVGYNQTVKLSQEKNDINDHAATFGIRLRVLRKHWKITQKEMAHRCAVTPETVNRYEMGGRDPSASYLRLIMGLDRMVNAGWLLTGEGPMLRDEATEPWAGIADGQVAVNREYLEVLKDNYELSKLRTLDLEKEILGLKGEISRLTEIEKQWSAGELALNDSQRQKAGGDQKGG